MPVSIIEGSSTDLEILLGELEIILFDSPSIIEQSGALYDAPENKTHIWGKTRRYLTNAPSVANKPLADWEEPYFLSKAFPTLFPGGKGGFTAPHPVGYFPLREHTELRIANALRHYIKLSGSDFGHRVKFRFWVFSTIQRLQAAYQGTVYVNAD